MSPQTSNVELKPAVSEKGATVRAQRTEPFEVLIQAVNGHRTIRRVFAADEAAATAAVQAEVNESAELGTTVIDSAPSGQGLGSGG
jgi:hypothetical protein